MMTSMYRFAGCEVDVDARRLQRDGEPAHLEPQAFDLLVHLLEQRHRVVPKHELLDGVWGHRFVSESALTTRIKEVRRAVGDDGRSQHVVQNVRGRGYRFVAELDREERGAGAHDRPDRSRRGVRRGARPARPDTAGHPRRARWGGEVDVGPCGRRGGHRSLRRMASTWSSSPRSTIRRACCRRSPWRSTRWSTRAGPTRRCARWPGSTHSSCSTTAST